MATSFTYKQLDHAHLKQTLIAEGSVDLLLSRRHGGRLRALIANLNFFRSSQSEVRKKMQFYWNVLHGAWLALSTFLFHQRLLHAFGVYLQTNPECSVTQLANEELLFTFRNPRKTGY